MQSENTVDKREIGADSRARQLAGLKPFQKGQSGNPAGRPKSAILSGVIRRNLDKVDPQDEQGRTFAEVIGERIVVTAAHHPVSDRVTISALREILDRTEGKPRQSITLTVEGREQMERRIEYMMEQAELLGEPCTRDEAIAALAIHYPEASQLIH